MAESARSLGLRLPIFVLVAATLDCITLTTVNVSQKTTLERQLMGEMEPLSEEELLASSVRTAGGVGVGSVEDLQARAIAARRRQLFNRDDLDALRKAGCAGEARAAQLVARACAAQVEGLDDATVTRLLAEECADREAIIDWAVAVDPALTPADRPKIVAVYERLLRERAAPGDWLEQPDGSWVRK